MPPLQQAIFAYRCIFTYECYAYRYVVKLYKQCMGYVSVFVGKGHTSQVVVFLVTLVVFRRQLHQRGDSAAIHEQYRWMLLNCTMSIYRLALISADSQQPWRRLMCHLLCLRKTPVPVLVVQRLLYHQVARNHRLASQVMMFH